MQSHMEMLFKLTATTANGVGAGAVASADASGCQQSPTS